MSNNDIDLGPCCICEAEGGAVRNILMIDRPGPTPGKGWGCLQCGLPMDGAVAVLCDACLQDYSTGKAQIKFVCSGRPAKDGRMPIVELSDEPFEHDLSKHPEAQ